ncbi:MarR family transcriptional regulator [Actinorhabdospora filicis]|uniref:MarR family transcriptional regulator n=1 Tax=Actinorhabdospora filicis TaxID=1785913 RepID=A0A9W6SF15_9ACTN|nr:MarR family winged helix-turn-helix transcriptional regulator [Actinorhabdospora filicis]GLZ75985.1 MarR family transcriptional regulator [Actinorhabdospora filicis]
MTPTNWLNEQEQAAWRGYREMYQVLAGTLEKQLNRDSGLSEADYTLLVVLSETPGQRLRARELRNEVGWDRSRLAHQLRRMEQRGLLVRTECETDARGTMVELTEQGRTAIVAAAPPHVEAVRAYFIDLLTPEEIATLTSITGRVVARIRAAGECDEFLNS